MNQQQAFDPLALTYDDAFTHTAIGRYLRGQVHQRLANHFPAGSKALELGCGTGEDALWLAGRGIRVTATDVSEGMLTAARAKTAHEPLIQIEKLDLRTPPSLHLWESETGGEGTFFDGSFSNFGPLNCLEDWRDVAAWLAAHIKPGGIAAFGVMSPLCLWEPLWHGLHGEWSVATRRWRKSVPFTTDTAGETITVTYPTIQRLTRDFAPHFRCVYARPLGLFLPPSDVFGVIEKRPRLLKTLLNLEERFGKASALSLFADHYWIEFQRL